MSEEFTYDHVIEKTPSRKDVQLSKEKNCSSTKKTTKSSSCYYFVNRLAFCLLAQIALWTTSLRNSTIIASGYIEAPTFSSVYQSCDSAHQEVILEKVKYDSCVEKQLKRCNLEFESSLVTENRRVAESQANNNRISRNLQTQISNCTKAIASTSLIVQSWTSGKHAQNVPYNASCSTESKLQLQTTLGEDHSSSNELTISASNFVEQYDSRIVTMATYTKDLSDYNADYIANKTRFLHLESLGQIDTTMLENIPSITENLDPIYDLTMDIIACMSLNATMAEKCTYMNSMYDAYVVAQRRMNNQISEVVDAVNAYEQLVNNYVDQVEMAIDKANLFYQSVFGNKGVISWLLNTVKIIYTLGDMCGNSVPNMCSFSPEDWAVTVPNWPSIPLDLKAPDASAIVNQVSGYVATISPRIAEVSASITSDLVALQDSLHISIDDIEWLPKDYNPPSYPYKNDTNQEVNDQREESQQYLTNLRNILYSRNFSTSSSSSTSSSLNMLLARNNPSALINATWVQSQTRSMWSWVQKKSHPMSIGNIEFLWILQSFLTLQGILFLFDYLYRAVQSLRLFVRFWSRSVIRLPTVDAIEKEEQALFNTLSSTVKCCQLFFRLLPLLWVQALILLAMLVATIYIVSALVVPEYYSYCRACVHHSTNETFLTQLTQTSLYNLAASGGNTRWVTGIASYNSYSTAACDKGIVTTQQPYTQSIQTLQSKNQTYAYYVSQANILKSCLDMSTMDASIRQHCCSQTTSLDDYSCNERNTSLTSICPLYLQTVSSKEMFLHSLWSPTPESPLVPSEQPACSPSYLLFESNSALPSLESNNNDVSSKSLVLRNAHNDVTSSAMFDCSVLPACELTCDGPNELLLARRSKDCMCRIEWFWNAHLLQGILVIVIFIILNISRDLICGGLLRIWWCHFLPPNMSVVITVPLPGYERYDLSSDEDQTSLIEKDNTKQKQSWISIFNNHSHKNEEKKETADKLKNDFSQADEDDRDIEAGYSIESCEGGIAKEINVEEDDCTSESTVSDDDHIDKTSLEKVATSNNKSLKSAKMFKKHYSRKSSFYNFKFTSDSKKQSKSSKSRKTMKETVNLVQKRLIEQRMRWKLFWFVFMGYVKIATGIAINYLWIALAQTIERNISYDGNPYPTASTQ